MPIETLRKKGKIVIHPSGPFLEVRNALHKRGFRYRVLDNRFAGTPHLVFPYKKLMIYTVRCEIAHPQDIPTKRMGWWDKQHRLDADELILIRRGMALQGWRCEVICNCEEGNQELLLRRLSELMGE
jgi:G:T-mismatch repair DNA endonuclease (very short patch repair protein)